MTIDEELEQLYEGFIHCAPNKMRSAFVVAGRPILEERNRLRERSEDAVRFQVHRDKWRRFALNGGERPTDYL